MVECDEEEATDEEEAAKDAEEYGDGAIAARAASTKSSVRNT